ncbi:HyaD/HybD family hydrogenase maturation endopeptidase [Helicobacter kayseriensis]|uniref:HyaD/HybD family hydrogenase maturation endopeptidase n=1 Tax=Helicobacter kayseriensis TaxID=2905877 RepID=UPI001E60324A|nr:HyaD/HybD family hydrogenase maturation endopeptidase [Helicobacter kayseriensis]MCE3046835.1 HyaD/HybD family hydrogenase maturation endopeptidase [Helicobacter kayseriensis]MCE3047863.1 HyaD/HybD family hydrogenase maturation endopeptidase [Helicobacter kayseriensis]
MKILILGIGNILFGDEGVGAHFAHYIDEKYQFLSKHQIVIIDGGTLAHQLIPLIVEFDRVILIDCIENEGGDYGDVFFFDYADMPMTISWQGSAHEVETLQTLEMMRTQGDIPSIKIMGVIPKRIGSDPTFALSDEVVGAVALMEEILCRYLLEIDPECQILSDSKVEIRAISQISFKRDMKQNDF